MKILAAIAPTGFSREFSDKVMEEALCIAGVKGAELTILSVGENFHDHEFLDEGTARVEEKLLDQAKTAVQRAREAAEAKGIHPRIVVESGVSPEENIVKLAEEDGTDLIVLGHRTRKGLSRFLIGSVASKVVAHAPCSVLVVR